MASSSEVPHEGETLAPLAVREETSIIADLPGNADATSSLPGPEETLEHAADLFQKGSKAIEDGDFVDAVDFLSRALEIRVAHYGELAAECASSYYKYGCALLYKAQEEADPLVDMPKNIPNRTRSEGSGSTKASIIESNLDNSNNEEEVCSDKDEENAGDGNNEASDGPDGEGETEVDEDEPDLDMAWNMLELARAIVEKSPEDTLEKVNILAALGEVSAEREDIDTSLNDYLKALSVLERLVEQDNRRMVELNFRVCLVLEVGSKIREAIPYCEKAISLCKSRLQRLNETTGNTSNGSSNGPASSQEGDKEVFGGILSELEKKLEDLQLAMTSPPPSIITEVVNMLVSQAAAPQSSSQMGIIETVGFDSPSESITAAIGGVITDLGVFGRGGGGKRATISPSVSEPPLKKPLMDSPTENAESSVSEVTGSSAAPAPSADTPME